MPFLRIALVCLLLTVSAHAVDKPPSGDTATVVVETPIYVSADTNSQRLDRITPGREMLIVERNGKWLRVFANTDVEQNREEDAPIFGAEESATPPISGWIEDKGVVSTTTPKGDTVLFGAATIAEQNATESHGQQRAAQDASLLYTRAAQIFPQSQLAPEAAWRAADIRWQLQKADIFSRPSAHEKENYLRQAIDETAMKKLQKKYPGTKWADLAAWDMLDNKICGDWQGSTKCPEKEAEMYEKYADEHPNSPKAPEALYNAVYRQAAAGDIYAGSDDSKKADAAHARAAVTAAKLEGKYPSSDWSDRAATLVYKVQQSIPIYGAGRE